MTKCQTRAAVLAAGFLLGFSGSATAAPYKVTLSAATDMEVSVGGITLKAGQDAVVEGAAISAMTMGKRRQFCIDPRSHTNVGQNVVIQNQGPHGCSWSVDSGSFHGYAEWSIEKEKYSFSGSGKITQSPPGGGQATLEPPAGSDSFSVSVSGETTWSYFRDAPGGRVTNRESESGSASITFVRTMGPGEPPTPAAQPPRDPSYPVDGLPLCKEALGYFGIQQPSQTHIRRGFDSMLAGFAKGIEAFKQRNPGVEPSVSVPNSSVAVPAALNWLFAEGGTAANLNIPGGQGLSQDFIFTRPGDLPAIARNQRGLYNGSWKPRKGTEAALVQAIVMTSTGQGNRKLSPGDVFGLALDQTGGDARLASLLAHNTLRSLARGADGNYTGIPVNRDFFTEYLETIRGDKLRTPPTGGDGLAGDYSGPWYHLFGTAFFELQVKGSQVGAIAAPLDPFGDPGSGMMSLTNAQWIRRLFSGGEFNPTTDSDIANRLEQMYREYLGGRSPDPEKYCFNVWGANMGAWLFNQFPARLGPYGATQPPAPQPQPQPSYPSTTTTNGTGTGTSVGGGGGWQPGGAWQAVK